MTEDYDPVAASAKLMDDWAERHGANLFGAVKIGYGPQHGEPQKSAMVRIGSAAPSLRDGVEQQISHPVPSTLPSSEPLAVILTPAPPQSWFRRFINLFKGVR